MEKYLDEFEQFEEKYGICCRCIHSYVKDDEEGILCGVDECPIGDEEMRRKVYDIMHQRM